MLKYNIKKRKYWVLPFFCDNLNWGAYIVSKELNRDPDYVVSCEFLSQAKSILSCLEQSGWRLSYIPDSCLKNKQKNKQTNKQN
jgi:hypothetical protein